MAAAHRVSRTVAGSLYAFQSLVSQQHIVQISFNRGRKPTGNGTRALGFCISIDSPNRSKRREKTEHSEYNTAETALYALERKTVVSMSCPLAFGIRGFDSMPSATIPSPLPNTTYGFPSPCVAL